VKWEVAQVADVGDVQPVSRLKQVAVGDEPEGDDDRTK